MNMNNTFKELFRPIRADEELKSQTKAYLTEKTQGYTKAKTKNHKYPLYAAICVCFFFILFGGYWIYFTPVAQISIDINPSIEMSINRFDQVIFVNDFNEDGQKLSKALDIKYKNYTDAIEQILHHDTVTALLSDNEIMTITVSGPDGQQSSKIFSGVEACAAEQNNTHCYFVSSEEVSKAHEMGLSCGKYRAFLEFQLLDPNITPEMIQKMTMKEIRERMDRLSAGEKDDISSHADWESEHHGHGGGHGRGWRNGKTEQQDNEG